MSDATPTDDDFPLRRSIPELQGSERDGPAVLETGSETQKAGGSGPTVIPRSASYVDISVESESTFEKDGIRRTFSDNVLSTLDSGLWRRTTSEKSCDGGQKSTTINKLARRKSSLFRKDMKVHVSRITIDEQQAGLEIAELPKAVLQGYGDDLDIKTRSVSGSLTNLARKSWLGASRSPSPSKRKSIATYVGAKASPEVTKEGSAGSLKKSPPLPPTPKENGTALTSGDHINLVRKDTTGRKAKRPLSVILRKSALSPGIKSPSIPVPSIPKSFSHDTLSSVHNEKSLSKHDPALHRSASIEKLQSSGADASRKRDELSSNFRSLDGEYQK